MSKIKQAKILLALSIIFSLTGIFKSMTGNEFDDLALITYDEYLITDDLSPEGEALWEDFLDYTATSELYYALSSLCIVVGVLFSGLGLLIIQKID